MSDNVIHVSDVSFDNEVLKSEIPVLVDFWAEWCGPCRALGPIVEKVAGQFVGKAKVVKVNVDESPNASVNYNIRGIPTLLIFKNGGVVATKVGNMTESQLVEFINSNL
jgi:thioredoxin 1